MATSAASGVLGFAAPLGGAAMCESGSPTP